MEQQFQLKIFPRPKRLDEYGEVLTVEEAAQVLRISRSSAYELARRWRSDNPSGLPVIQLGRFLRVPRSALESMLIMSHDNDAGGTPSGSVVESALDRG